MDINERLGRARNEALAALRLVASRTTRLAEIEAEVERAKAYQATHREAAVARFIEAAENVDGFRGHRRATPTEAEKAADEALVEALVTIEKGSDPNWVELWEKLSTDPTAEAEAPAEASTEAEAPRRRRRPAESAE